MPALRARAMKDVHTRWEENQLKEFCDIQRLVDEFSGSEDEETFVQQEFLVIGDEGAASDDDKAVNDDVEFSDDGEEGLDAASPSAAASSLPPAPLACETASKPAAIVPSPTDTSVVPTGTAERNSIFADYDEMILIAKRNNDARLVRILEISKNDCFKLKRHLDPDIKKALQEEQSRLETEREAMRKVEYEKDRKAKAELAAKKKADEEKKAKAKEAAETKAKLEQLKLQIDTSPGLLWPGCRNTAINRNQFLFDLIS